MRHRAKTVWDGGCIRMTGMLYDGYERHEMERHQKYRGGGMRVESPRATYIDLSTRAILPRQTLYAQSICNLPIRLQSPKSAVQLPVLHPETHPPNKPPSAALLPTKTPTPPYSSSSTTTSPSPSPPAICLSRSANPLHHPPAAVRSPQGTTSQDAPHTTPV